MPVSGVFVFVATLTVYAVIKLLKLFLFKTRSTNNDADVILMD